MLRSTVVQENADNMVALWGTQGSSIVHSHGRRIAVKPLTANSKGIKVWTMKKIFYIINSNMFVNKNVYLKKFSTKKWKRKSVIKRVGIF